MTKCKYEKQQRASLGSREPWIVTGNCRGLNSRADFVNLEQIGGKNIKTDFNALEKDFGTRT